MRTDTKSRHRTKVGGNVFLDLGFSPKEAKRLLARADAQDEPHDDFLVRRAKPARCCE